LAALTIGLTLAVAAVSVQVLFEEHMRRRIASELETRLADLAATVAVRPGGAIGFSRAPPDPRYEQPLSGAYWQVEENGRTALRSRSLWDQHLPSRGAGSSEPFEAEGDDGAELYVLEKAITIGATEAERRIALSVALDHREIQALSDAFATDLDWALGTIALALFAGAILQTQLGFAPLRRLGGAIEGVRSGATSRLVGRFPSEIAPLADDLNALLGRNELLLAKTRERAGQLAHGFKTPLTILTLEARKLAECGQGEASRILHEQIDTMRRHVDRELTRARVRGTPAGGSAIGWRLDTDLAAEANRLVRLIQRMPRGDTLDVSTSIPGGLQLAIDASDLREVLGNLMDNARKWARTAMCLHAEMTSSHIVRIEVRDDGPGFDRQSPRDIVTDGESSGLGLGIVADVLEAYGSTLAIERTGRWTCVCFEVQGRSTRDGQVRNRRRTTRAPADTMS
jgi:signal transduction histidine kinase